MKVLVTGANGFIGSFLCPALIEKGFGVSGLAMPGEDASRAESLGVATLRGDLTDPASIRGIADGVDIVFHLAGRVTDWGPRSAFYSAIFDATSNLLEEARGKVGRFVYVSSVAACGIGRHLAGKREEDPVWRSGLPYADAKADSERLCRDRCLGADTELTIVRPSNVIGPGSVWVRDIIERFMTSAVPVIDGGKHSASLIYVRNLVDGLVLAGTMEDAAGQMYQLRDDYDVNWKRYLDDLGAMVGKKTSVSIPYRAAWLAAYLLEKTMAPLGKRPLMTRFTAGIMGRDLDIDNTKAKRELGWTTRVSYEEAMAEIADWVAENYKCERLPPH